MSVGLREQSISSSISPGRSRRLVPLAMDMSDASDTVVGGGGVMSGLGLLVQSVGVGVPVVSVAGEAIERAGPKGVIMVATVDS